jgi:CheY-like chemotaxis protein
MKLKILLVEDNEPIRDNTTELLELHNYAVTATCNGQEGLEAALRHPPDLILCDIQMPVMDGYHLFEHIRKYPALHSIRFVFFTASAEKKEVDAGMKMGADDYIVKPFTAEHLLEVLQKNLD